jgi:hypothetical protein
MKKSLLVVLFSIGAVAHAQDNGAAAMAKYAAVSPEHKQLTEWAVGEWNVKGKMWFGPDKAVDTSGTASARAIMGGRYIDQDFTATMMGQPFEGRSTTGWDVAKQKFVKTWIDSLSTSITTCEDTLVKKTLTSSCNTFDPTTAKSSTMRIVITYGVGTHTDAYYENHAGKEVKIMELVYTKK